MAFPQVRSRRALTALALLAGASGFMAVHLADQWRWLSGIREHVRPEYAHRLPGATGQLFGFGILAIALYLGFALLGVAIAAKTNDKLLWVLPAALFVLGPMAGGVVGLGLVHPQPILSFMDGSPIPGWLQSMMISRLCSCPEPLCR